MRIICEFQGLTKCLGIHLVLYVREVENNRLGKRYHRSIRLSAYTNHFLNAELRASNDAGTIGKLEPFLLS